MRLNQCTIGTIFAAQQCTMSVQMNWLTYLLNELLEDAADAQEKGNILNYSWLLILISFVAWEEPLDYQGVDVPRSCRGTKHQNFWVNKENP